MGFIAQRRKQEIKKVSKKKLQRNMVYTYTIRQHCTVKCVRNVKKKIIKRKQLKLGLSLYLWLSWYFMLLIVQFCATRILLSFEDADMRICKHWSFDLISVGIKYGFSCINICQSQESSWKVFNSPQGTWQMLMQ